MSDNITVMGLGVCDFNHKTLCLRLHRNYPQSRTPWDLAVIIQFRKVEMTGNERGSGNCAQLTNRASHSSACRVTIVFLFSILSRVFS
jgi:hypothetical protein